MIDGNKTIIGLSLVQLFTTRISLEEPYNTIVLVVIWAWTGISAYDHVVRKKSFSPNYK